MSTAEEKIVSICEKEGFSTPIEFLTQIMSGRDPRQVSTVYLRIKELEKQNGDTPPDDWEWAELVALIKSDYQFSIVEIAKSQDAAKQLMEYMHPKRKSIEQTNTIKTADTSTLSKREIKNIRKAFDIEY